MIQKDKTEIQCINEDIALSDENRKIKTFLCSALMTFEEGGLITLAITWEIWFKGVAKQ